MGTPGPPLAMPLISIKRTTRININPKDYYNPVIDYYNPVLNRLLESITEV